MVKKISFNIIYLILTFVLVGNSLFGCEPKNTETIYKENNYQASKNNIFDELSLKNNWDISFNGVIDNKLLFNIYEKDGTDIYKTIGLYYMDTTDNKIYTLKEISEGRIWDFKYENGSLIYSKIQQDKNNPKNPYIIEVIQEKDNNTQLLDTGYIYDPQRTPSFQKIGDDYYYIFESLLINDSYTNEYYSSFNKINNFQKEIIFQNYSTMKDFSISSDQWHLSSTEFYSYNNIGTFLATKNNNTLLYIFKDNKLTEKKFDDIITNAWILGDNILLKIRSTSINEEAKFEYKLYNIYNYTLKSINIDKEIFRVVNLDDNTIVFLDDKNNTNILKYINDKLEMKTLDNIPSMQNFYYNIDKNSFFIYQYKYDNNKFENYLYKLDLKK